MRRNFFSPNSKVAFFLFLFLFSCSVNKHYHPPVVEVPNYWKWEEPQENDLPDENWWLIFHDEDLNYLIDLALIQNPTLDEALFRIGEARALAGIQYANYYPQISFEPNFFRQGSRSNTDFGFNLNIPNPQQPGAQDIPERLLISEYQVPFNLIYEIDLWGKYRSGYFAAVARLQAASEAYKVAILMLTEEIAETYFDLLTLDAEEKVLLDAIEVRQKQLDIVTARFKAGIVSFDDQAKAETELMIAKADVETVKRDKAARENAISVLVGELPSTFCFSREVLERHPPLASTVLPCQVLLRRPDLQEAERNIRAFHDEIGVAYAELFPSLTVNGQLGFASADRGNLFDWESRLWSYGAAIFQSVFDAGRRQSNIQAAKARYGAVFSAYRNQVLVAFQEVEDALATLKFLRERQFYLEKAVASATTSRNLAQERYLKGLVNYLEVVDAERTLLDVARQLKRAQGDRFIATVRLIRALGG